MATTKNRVAVVRISRQFLNQINPKNTQDDADKDPSNTHLNSHSLPGFEQTSSNKKEEYNLPNTKTDLFTLTVPRTSDGKSDDPFQQNVHTESFRPSAMIHQQPIQTTTWIKQPLNRTTRPELHWQATNTWSHSLWSLSDDWNMCCYASTCWCCFRHEISSMMGEHWCLWFVNCTPLMELRTKFRQQYSIRGSIAEDFCLTTFCPLCVALQLANEGRDYGHRIFS